ncbi:hypothetical protein C8R45DRAFT_946113 [Mycena sanguinolenta]|nr:hypothetical protein C8R45DRAFT_946113 [Mycena sanguinolenta]
MWSIGHGCIIISEGKRSVNYYCVKTARACVNGQAGRISKTERENPEIWRNGDRQRWTELCTSITEFTTRSFPLPPSTPPASFPSSGTLGLHSLHFQLARQSILLSLPVPMLLACSTAMICSPSLPAPHENDDNAPTPTSLPPLGLRFPPDDLHALMVVIGRFRIIPSSCGGISAPFFIGMAWGGLSSKSKIRVGGQHGAKAQRATARMEFDNAVAALSFIQREEMLEIREDRDYDMADAPHDDDWLSLGPGNNDDWEDVPGTGIHTFPPREEALLQSHAGGEAIMHQLMDVAATPTHDPFAYRSRLCYARAQDPLLRTPPDPLFHPDTSIARTSRSVPPAWPLSLFTFNQFSAISVDLMVSGNV